MQRQQIIQLIDIKKYYKVGTHIVKALQSISLEIYKNEFLPMEGAQYFIEIPEKIKPGEYILQIKNKSNVQIEKLIMAK